MTSQEGDAIRRQLSAAQEALLRNDATQAVRICDHLLAGDARFVPALCTMASAEMRLGRTAAAKEHIARALEVEPLSRDAMMQLATWYWATGDLPQAEAQCRRIVDLHAEDAKAQNALALILITLGKNEEAVQASAAATRLDPSNASFWHNLGLAYQNLDRRREAISAYQKAAEVAPNSSPTLANLGSLLLQEGAVEEAAECLRRAGESGSTTAEGKTMLAQAIYLSLGDLEEAEALLDQALAAKAANPQGLVVRGMVRQQLGRFSQAREDLKAAIHLRPDDATAYCELVYAGKAGKDDLPLIEQMRKLARAPGRSANDQKDLHFALGKALDDLGRYEEAFAHFREANRVAKATPPSRYYPVAAEAACSKTMRAYDKKFFTEHRREGSPSEAPIFIVGLFRSGTTLVEQVLSSHPEVRAGGELPFWVDKWTALGEKAFTAQRGDGLKQWGAEYLEILRKIAPEASRVTNKHPQNDVALGLIHAALPHARIISCARHPADNCLSLFTTNFQRAPAYCYSEANIVSAYRLHRRLMAHWRETIPAERFFDIQYEQLVRTPEPIIRAMLQFCGLEWAEECLHPESNRGAVRTASRWQVRQPIYNTSVERWKHYEPWLGPFGDLVERAV